MEKTAQKLKSSKDIKKRTKLIETKSRKRFDDSSDSNESDSDDQFEVVEQEAEVLHSDTSDSNDEGYADGKEGSKKKDYYATKRTFTLSIVVPSSIIDNA